MNGRRWLRLGAKTLREVASIGFGGALAACLVINLVGNRESAAEFAAARRPFAVIADYVLIPSMAIVVSGLIALAATRAYQNAVWARVKALLGLSTFEATLLVVGSGRQQAALAAAAADPALVDALLRAERNTLWLLIAVSIANVVLAVWRPRLTVTVR